MFNYKEKQMRRTNWFFFQRHHICLFLLFSTLLGNLAFCENSNQDTVFVGIPLTHRTGTWGIVDAIGDQNTPRHLSSLRGGESGVGTLISPAFVLNSDKIVIMARGWDGSEPPGQGANRICLADADTGKILRCDSPPMTTYNAKPIQWDVAELKGKNVAIKLIDGHSGLSFAWLGIDSIDAGASFKVDFSKTKDLDGWHLEGVEANNLIKHHYGVPYISGTEVNIPEGGISEDVLVGFVADRLMFFGMTKTNDWGAPLWWYPSDYSVRYWVGDKFGDIILRYEDGSKDRYPLIIGEGVWWGNKFYEFPEPFKSEPNKMETLEESIKLYPAYPVSSGFRMAVIHPKPIAIKSVAFHDEAGKYGSVRIKAMTAEIKADTDHGTNEVLAPGHIEKITRNFIDNRGIDPSGINETQRKENLERIAEALYVTNNCIPKSIAVSVPKDYKGPRILFRGGLDAQILTNVFYHNLHDMRHKLDADGLYHESNERSATFGGYFGFGTFTVRNSPYRSQVWARGVGRAVQELMAFGFHEESMQCAHYCFEQAALWADPSNSHLTINGHPIPPHWSRVINSLAVGPHSGVFENDGHGLIMLLVYNVWRRMPLETQKKWLMDNWHSVRDAAEWILWQFENPELSGATDVLLSDSEGVFMIGIGVRDERGIYADYPCMEGLRVFSKMAEFIGKDAYARRWTNQAQKMRVGIERNYIQGDDVTHPRAWSLWGAGWSHQTGVFAPLIMLPDTKGFLPGDDCPEWRRISKATYNRFVQKWIGSATDKMDDEYWYLPHEIPIATRPEQHFRQFGLYGISMGYCQSFATQAALLLDKIEDAGKMLEWMAKIIYYPEHEPFIVPEGVEVHPNGTKWYRTGDLGNGFQQSSVMKVLRLVIGVDDTQGDQLRIVPRIPKHWGGIEIESYPAWVKTRESGDIEQIAVNYRLQQEDDNSLLMDIKFDKLPEKTFIRLGPFKTPKLNVTINCKQVQPEIEKSGDGYWVTCRPDDNLSKMLIAIRDISNQVSVNERIR